MPYVPLPMLGNASVPAYGSANGLGFQKLEKFCTSHQKWKEERYGDWKKHSACGCPCQGNGPGEIYIGSDDTADDGGEGGTQYHCQWCCDWI